MIDTGKNMDEIYNFLKKHPNKNLFRKLSQKAMENLDFDIAQKSMLQVNDFNGLQFLERMKIKFRKYLIMIIMIIKILKKNK